MPSAAKVEATAIESCDCAKPTPTTTMSQPMAFPGRRTTSSAPIDAQLKPEIRKPTMVAPLNPNIPVTNGVGDT